MGNINITINGEKKDVPENSTVQELVDSMKIKNKMFVVEKNLKIVNKEDYSVCKLEAGDSLEIIGFFGGG